MIEGIELGDTFPPIKVMVLNEKTGYVIDDGHRRAYSHYISQRPILIDIRYESSNDEPLKHIRFMKIMSDSDCYLERKTTTYYR